MSLIVKTNFDANAITVEPPEDSQTWNNVVYEFIGDKYPINLKGCSFGVTINQEGENQLTFEYPPAGVLYQNTSEPVVVVESVQFRPGRATAVTAWAKRWDVELVSQQVFTTPLPPAPYDSWFWSEELEIWSPPIPYPEDGGDYVWDEETGDWLEVTDEAV